MSSPLRRRPRPDPEPAPIEADIRAFTIEREKLVEAGQLDEADVLCGRWLAGANTLARAECYKCSANVFIRRAAPFAERAGAKWHLGHHVEAAADMDAACALGHRKSCDDATKMRSRKAAD